MHRHITSALFTKMRATATTVVTAILFVSGTANVRAQEVSNQIPLGIWSWNQNAMATTTARRTLLDFCSTHGISHIDQHVSIRQDGNAFRIHNSEQLSKLISAAASKGISVSALRGERTMFFSKNHEDVLAKLTALIEFNQQLPDGTSLRGIKYDVEPYLTKEWKAGGKPRETVMRDYLDCLVKIRQSLQQHHSDMQLSVDVPFWWDKAEHALLYSGKSLAFVHHIQERVDSIAIMSYRRSAEDVVRLSEQEIAYASKTKNSKRSVALGLNFNHEIGSESITTFAGHPPSEFRRTLKKLQTILSKENRVHSIMLHEYTNLSVYLRQ